MGRDWAKMLTAKKNDYSTPIEFFKELDKEFHFTLDAASSHENALCEKHYTEEDDGLKQDWGGETVWCNPPYCFATAAWMEKCYKESRKPNTVVVALVPSRTSTRWFHEWVYGKAELRFVKGRLKFGGSKYRAPFDSLVVIFR